MKYFIIILFICAACSVTFAPTGMIHSFNRGELSGQIESRYDLKMWYSGCRVLENFYCQTHGGAAKRPGSYYIAETADSTVTSRLIGFDGSDGEARILEFGEKTIRFYKE